MKNKNTALAMMMALAAAGPALAPSTAARADSGTPVEAIEIHGLRAYANRTLKVYYVSARPASLGLAGEHLEVRKVMMDPVSVEISSSGDAEIPATSVPRSGFVAFNYVMFETSSSGSQASLVATGPDTVQLVSEYVGFAGFHNLDRYRDNFGRVVLSFHGSQHGDSF